MEASKNRTSGMRETAARALELLIANRITERDLVKKYGFGKGTVIGWKEGRDLSMDKVREVCRIVNISISEFFSPDVFGGTPVSIEERKKLLSNMINELDEKQVEVAIRCIRDLTREI